MIGFCYWISVLKQKQSFPKTQHEQYIHRGSSCNILCLTTGKYIVWKKVRLITAAILLMDSLPKQKQE